LQHEAQYFAGVAQLITQLQLGSTEGQEGARSKVVSDLNERATALRTTLLDHMWKEDTLILPLIVQNFSPEEVSQLVQNFMAIRPTETVQTIVQFMVNKDHKDTAELASGPKIPIRESKHVMPVSSANGVGQSHSGGLDSADTLDLESPSAGGVGAAGFCLRQKAPVTFKRWGAEDDKLLHAAVNLHNGKNWKKISDGVPDRNGVQCYQRWQRLKPGVIKGNFTSEEDRVLRSMAGAQHAKNWREIAKQLPGRSGKQCRDRWCNVLDPSLKKSKWTNVEDEVVVEAYQRVGNSWAAIQQLLPGRTQLQVRDRVRTLVGRSLNPSSSSAASSPREGADVVRAMQAAEMSSSVNGQVAHMQAVADTAADSHHILANNMSSGGLVSQMIGMNPGAGGAGLVSQLGSDTGAPSNQANLFTHQQYPSNYALPYAAHPNQQQ
jgi:myb proto-oncogene protein